MVRGSERRKPQAFAIIIMAPRPARPSSNASDIEIEGLASDYDFANTLDQKNPNTKTGQDKTATTGQVSEKEESAKEHEKGELCGVKDLYPSQNSVCKCCTDWLDDIPFKETHRNQKAESKRETFAINHRKVPHGGTNTWKTHSLIINSARIQSALGAVFDGYPVNYAEESQLILRPSFTPFVHRWDKFLEVERMEQDAETKNHLHLLRLLLEEELKPSFRILESINKSGYVKFADIELVYVPGDILIYETAGAVQARLLQACVLEKSDESEHYRFLVQVMDWNGTRFELRGEIVGQYRFGGTQAISDLNVFPIRFHPEKDTLWNSLVERGKKFENLAGQHLKYYCGHAISESGNWWRKVDKTVGAVYLAFEWYD